MCLHVSIRQVASDVIATLAREPCAMFQCSQEMSLRVDAVEPPANIHAAISDV